jgi:LysR substrate binding domain
VVDLVGESLDVAIRIGALADSSAMMRKLADNRRILVASPAYLDCVGRPATPEEAADQAFLRYGVAIEPWRLRGPNGATASLAATARLRVDDGDVVHDWAVREQFGDTERVQRLADLLADEELDDLAEPKRKPEGAALSAGS